MEKENKRENDKRMKKERARIIKFVELAYKNDPRVKRQKEIEEQEKLRKKAEIRESKDKVRRDIEEKEKVIQDAKQRELDIKLDLEKRAKEDKKTDLARRKETVKLLSTLCEEKATGTNYDRYFFEEFTKRFKLTSQIEEIYQKLESVKMAKNFVEEVENIVVQNHTQ